MSVPFIDLKRQYADLETSIHNRMHTVLAHGQYIMGPEVKQLEETLEIYTGAKYCLGVSSGTDALLISLMALGITSGDEVITTAFSFAATAEVIFLCGATPVFVDVNPKTCLIDIDLIESKITERTRAIIPVSLYGQTCDMDRINDLAERHGDIAVIEDAAQSFGATYRGAKSCNLSTLGCTSFFPSKPLGCYGDGGAIFTNDERLYEACRQIRVHGQSSRYKHTRMGVAGRLDTLQAAVLLAKLERFDWEVEERARIGSSYNELLDARGIEYVQVVPDATSVYGQYTVFVDDREAVIKRLQDLKIPTAVHYPTPLNHQLAFSHACCLECTPEAERISKRVMSIPMHPYLKLDQQSRIADALVARHDHSL